MTNWAEQRLDWVLSHARDILKKKQEILVCELKEVSKMLNIET